MVREGRGGGGKEQLSFIFERAARTVNSNNNKIDKSQLYKYIRVFYFVIFVCRVLTVFLFPFFLLHKTLK